MASYNEDQARASRNPVEDDHQIDSQAEASDSFEKPLNVFDLPQISDKPSYEELIEALIKLKVKPASWSSRVANEPQSEQDRKACARYLTNIISSNLTWLASNREREDLWEKGSRCLSERCGRTGAPAMTRTWKLWDEVSLVIHEPPLTGDNLGLKTWASSYMLAKRLETIGLTHKVKELDENLFAVMELGSGTGLVGLAAAAIWKCAVVLTDLPEIIPNLRRNVEHNRKMIIRRGGYARAQALDWDNLPAADEFGNTFQFIVAADPLYSPKHAPMLAHAIDVYLWKDPEAKAIIELPYRDQATRAMAQDLRRILDLLGFELVEQGEETGFDDWEENGEMAEVKCWWGIWGRRCERTADEGVASHGET